jgi:hypothetical protein
MEEVVVRKDTRDCQAHPYTMSILQLNRAIDRAETTSVHTNRELIPILDVHNPNNDQLN